MNEIIDVNYRKEIASIIYSQLKMRIIELMAWGAKDFMSLNRTIDNESYPALIFSIRTPKVKRGGRVIISLNEGSDTYIVEAVKITGGKEKLLGIEKEVYCNELHNTINYLIEDEESYHKIFF